MVVVARLIQSAQVAQARLSPKLAWPFETALALATSRFDSTTSDRPAPISNFLVVHPSGLTRKIVLLLFHGLAPVAPRGLQSSNLLEHALLLSVSQPM